MTIHFHSQRVKEILIHDLENANYYKCIDCEVNFI